jgi:hypothetical protein
MPWDRLLDASPAAVLGVLAVLAVGSLVLVVRSFVGRIWSEIDVLRKRSHRHATRITALLLKARIEVPDDDEES